MRDRQQQAVYSWEESFRSFIEHTATRAQVRRLIGRACAMYGVTPPSVQFRSKANGRHVRLTSDYDPSLQLITIGFKDCNHAIAMHEAAHAIVDELYENVETHGPEFMGVYLELLEWAKVAPRSALHASAQAKGLDWRTRLPKRARKRTQR